MDHKEYKLLTKEEEIAAWERGDFNALVESVMPFVIKAVRRFASPGELAYDELVSRCNLQLAVALKTYDPHRTRFITYACNHIYANLAHTLKMVRKRQARIGSNEVERIRDHRSRETDVIDAQDAANAMLVVLKEACTDMEYQTLIRRLEGETFQEIAATSKQAAHQTIKRVRKRARDLFPSLAEIGA
ncbi:MAG: sigma-70 family RNA polymerase sigma factor [Aureliella sp.]